jgi:cytochrome P450
LNRTFTPARLKRLVPILEQHAEREFNGLLSSHRAVNELGTGPQASSVDIFAQFGTSFAAWVEVLSIDFEDETSPALSTTAAKWVSAWRQRNSAETSKQHERLYELATKLSADWRASPRDPGADPASSLLREVSLEEQPLEAELLMWICFRSSKPRPYF